MFAANLRFIFELLTLSLKYYSKNAVSQSVASPQPPWTAKDKTALPLCIFLKVLHCYKAFLLIFATKTKRKVLMDTSLTEFMESQLKKAVWLKTT